MTSLEYSTSRLDFIFHLLFVLTVGHVPMLECFDHLIIPSTERKLIISIQQSVVQQKPEIFPKLNHIHQ